MASWFRDVEEDCGAPYRESIGHCTVKTQDTVGGSYALPCAPRLLEFLGFRVTVPFM